MKIVISDKARRDLLRLYRYLDQRNPKAATEIFEEIDAKFVSLSRFPFIGRERSSLAPGLRSVIVRTNLILYSSKARRSSSYA